MKLKSLKKTDIAEQFEGIEITRADIDKYYDRHPKAKVAKEIEELLLARKLDFLLSTKELEDLTLFMEKKREIGIKNDKEGRA